MRVRGSPGGGSGTRAAGHARERAWTHSPLMSVTDTSSASRALRRSSSTCSTVGISAPVYRE